MCMMINIHLLARVFTQYDNQHAIHYLLHPINIFLRRLNKHKYINTCRYNYFQKIVTIFMMINVHLLVRVYTQ